ncbi:hypothetical protein ACWDYJ_16815 [Streptomyces sp. NPDC003042]
MSGARFARTVSARVLTVACVVLLCLFGAGPAATTAMESRAASSASSAPAEPTEGQSDPASDPEARAALRTLTRATPTVPRLPPRMFHVKHAGPASRATFCEAAVPALSCRAVRSVVLRC